MVARFQQIFIPTKSCVLLETREGGVVGNPTDRSDRDLSKIIPTALLVTIANPVGWYLNSALELRA